LKGTKGFVIALVSDNGLVDHLKNMFGYVRVSIDKKAEQTMKEICSAAGFDTDFMRILD
jgi:hypothetical protein